MAILSTLGEVGEREVGQRGILANHKPPKNYGVRYRIAILWNSFQIQRNIPDSALHGELDES